MRPSSALSLDGLLMTARDKPAPRNARRRLRQARDRLVASDPAFSRLRTAVRTMLSLFITGAALGSFQALVHPLPIASYGIGVVISLTGSMMIRDTSSLGQLISRACAALAATLSVLIASALAARPLAADAAFLLVIFGAVYIRRYGVRWFGVGMIGFMAYFMGDYLHPRISDMGWVALAVVVAFAVTHLVTTVLLKDQPEPDFRRALVTIDRRIDLILRALREQADGVGHVSDRKPLRDHVAQLRSAVLMAEGFIPQGDQGSLAAEGAASDLAVALFELQLSVERAVGAAFAQMPARALISAVLHGDEAVVEDWRTRTGPDPGGGADGDGAAARWLIRIHSARSHLQAVLGPRPSPAFAAAPEIAAPAQSGGGSPQGRDRGLAQALHVPIQVTLAAAIALGCGQLLSSARWYWAVTTAFIVFNNTRSRADTALRALQRSAGTFAGVIVGAGVATLLAGQTLVPVAGILLLFFVGFYFVQVSYSTMIFCITVALALLYGVMGMFTPHLLLLRLGETVVGGAAGAGVAFFVFPNRATTAVETTLASYVEALRALVEAARQRACGRPGGDHLLARSRAVDRAYTDLANAVRPMGGPWTAVTRFGAVREKLLLLSGCAHWGRSLARGLAGDDPPAAGICERIEAAADELAARAATACRLGSAVFEGGRDHREDLEGPRRPLPMSTAEDPAFSLEMILVLLSRAIS
jgi:hypothetical protein